MDPNETFTDACFPPQPDAFTVAPAPDHPRRRLKAMVAGLAFAAMLGGGAVTVLAASPDPSASPTPATSPSTNSGGSTTTPGTHGNCPHMQTNNSTTNSSPSGSTSG